MSATTSSPCSPFANALADGLAAVEKHIDPRFLYDSIGEQLFSAVVMLPEYGIPHAESRVLNRHAGDIRQLTGPRARMVELAYRTASRTKTTSGSGFLPALAGTAEDWLASAGRLASERSPETPMLFRLSGGALGDLDRSCRAMFLRRLRGLMLPGDFLLLSADLVKRVERMVAAYDDAAGIFAAFNKNVLARVNRELGGHFNLRQFTHEARWNAFLRRIELYLVARNDHQVYISDLMHRFDFARDETIRTATTYKFCELELEELAHRSGFSVIKTWTDLEWPFAEALWSAMAWNSQ